MKNNVFKFISLENAQSFANHAIKPMVVIMGDDERYWVVTLAHADRLIRAGYDAI